MCEKSCNSLKNKTPKIQKAHRRKPQPQKHEKKKIKKCNNLIP